MKHIVVAVLAALFAAIPIAAQAEDELPPIRAFNEQLSVMLGRYIYRDDLLASKASDILAEKLAVEQAQKERLVGVWITHLSKTVNVVRFLREGATGLEAAYDVTFQGTEGGAMSVPQDRALTEDELAQYRARKLALENIPRPCAKRYNTVAFNEPNGNWLVWTLAATTTPGELIYGGHYRFTISKDGKTIIQRDALSRACFAIGPPDTSKGKPVMQAVVQLVGPIPVETTVWLSMQTDIPFVIITGPNDSDRWIVSRGAMSQLSGK